MWNANSEPYPLSYTFDSHRNYLVSVGQGVMQDIFWVARDDRAIRHRSIKCMFLRTCDAPDETAEKFVILVWHGVKVSVPVTFGSSRGVPVSNAWLRTRRKTPSGNPFPASSLATLEYR